MSALDLTRPRRVHLVGVGGAGMSGIARMLLQRGHRVTGSDRQDSRTVDGLRAMGADIRVGHDPSSVAGAEVVVTSTAIPPDNPEVAAARDAGIPVVHRSEMLAALMAGHRAVLVTGTHGKTTTTSMLVVALQAAGADPSFAIGGALNEAGSNAHAGSGELFVAEADESDRSFLAYRPDVAVVTNVDFDHPDVFSGAEDTAAAFRAFLERRSPGAPAVVGVDDPGGAQLAADLRAAGDEHVVTVGEQADATVRLVVAEPATGPEPAARLRQDGRDLVTFRLAIPGRHNLRNAAAALAACWVVGADLDAAAGGLASFGGPLRRFQRLGSARGVEVVDDYAHNPPKLRAALAAARSVARGRVVVVVQPHRYSRTAALGAELGRAAAGADLVVVTDVYGADEEPVPGVSGELVARAAEEAGARVAWIPHLGDVAGWLAANARSGDLVLLTGAGDVNQVGPELLEVLEAEPRAAG